MTSSPSALVKLDRPFDVLANDPEWQRIWLALQAEAWRSLAVVPVDRGIQTLPIVHALAAVAWQQRGTPVIVADLRAVGLPILDAVRAEIKAKAASGSPLVMALAAFDESPVALAMAQAADRAVICVRLGTTRAARARDTLQKLGAEKCLGSITVRPKSA